MSETPQPKEQNSYDLVLLLWARRKMIIGITLLSILCGIVAAIMITPLFKSSVLMFPAITQSTSKGLLYEYSGSSEDVLSLGDEEDGEQLMQVLSSDMIRNTVAEQFDLYTVYGIESDSKTREAELKDAYLDHVTFEYTKFGSIEAQVLDDEPQRASDMANFIADQVDTVWSDMVAERAVIGYDIVTNNVRELEESIAQLEDSMKVLRLLGVHDYRTQSERYNEYMGAAILKGDKRAVRELEERFNVLALYGGAYVTLQDLIREETIELGVLHMKLRHAEADLKSTLPHKFIVDRAVPADKKSYPIRWLVVAMSAIAGLVLALLLIVVQVNIQKIREANG
ncbi:MAG: hypothetical protein KA408_01015 [Flavobacteriales bacterium]|nr:hypothetical protein [Flavobacteriales bacterium]